MSIRPFRDIKRRKTKVINVGNVKIGGDHPISVQSMTNTLTTNIKATINQINEIKNEGQGSLNFSNISLSSDPAFTPTLIEQLLFLAALTISFIFFLSPILPGFILKQLAPFSAASIALL